MFWSLVVIIVIARVYYFEPFDKFDRPLAAPAVVKSDAHLTALASELVMRIKHLPAAERLAFLRQKITGKIVFTTSFGIEDQAILHMIQSIGRSGDQYDSNS